jgi:uncharacterized membrane-anchored protein YitT (DUF2179 family)
LSRIISKKGADGLVNNLRAADFGVTRLDGEGATGPVQVIFTIVQRKQLASVVSIIKGFDSRAFYSIEDIRSASEGIFPDSRGPSKPTIPVQAAMARLLTGTVRKEAA